MPDRADPGGIEIRRVGRHERDLIGPITALINRAYAPAIAELWSISFDRVAEPDVARFVDGEELLVAEQAGTLAGAVRWLEIDAATDWFELLAVDPARTGAGVGRMLVDAVEAAAAARGKTWMQLELLLPSPATRHQGRLQQWYARRGYVELYRREFVLPDPRLQAALRSPCASVRHRKRLVPETAG